MIEIKIIFNIFLVIMILYLLYEFYNRNKYVVSDNVVKRRKLRRRKKVQFKTEESDKDNVQKDIKENFACKTDTPSVLPANEYTTYNNTPNFTSNVEDLRKFYNYTQYAGLEKLPEKDYDPMNGYMKNAQIIDEVSKQPSYFSNGSNGKTLKRDYWQYNDEMAMCGGDMNGIVGYDTLDSGYAIYDENNMKIKKVSEKDDLRMGMGVPQQEASKYNMSQP
jgi:hypothetical protein